MLYANNTASAQISVCDPPEQTNLIEVNSTELCDLFQNSGKPKLSITTNLTTGNFNGQAIIIEKNIDISGTVTFTNCLIQIKPNIRITLKGKLTLDDCKLFTCKSTWIGIYTIKGSSLTMTNNCRIEDAIVAVNATPGSTLSFSGTNFNRNGIGLGINGTMSLTLFEGNTFECTSSLNGNQTGVIVKNNPSLNLIGKNTFKNLKLGIGIYNSTVQVEGSSFESLISGGNTSVQTGVSFPNGTAIGISLGRLSNKACQFTNAYNGIYEQNAGINSVESTFTNISNYSMNWEK